MLQDGVTLAAGSSVSNLVVESGAAFPATPTDGQQFNLSAQFGAYAPGVYIYEASTLTWSPVGDIQAVLAGSGLAGGGTEGVVTLTLDRTALPYDIGVNAVGKPAANDTVMRLTCVRAFNLPADFTNSKAVAGANSTGSAVFSVKKNGVQIGTVTFSAGSPNGVFAAASATAFAVNDVLTITAPATQDATLADIGITLAATLAA